MESDVHSFNVTSILSLQRLLIGLSEVLFPLNHVTGIMEKSTVYICNENGHCKGLDPQRKKDHEVRVQYLATQITV